MERTEGSGTVNLCVNLRCTFHRLGDFGHVCLYASFSSLKLASNCCYLAYSIDETTYVKMLSKQSTVCLLLG